MFKVVILFAFVATCLAGYDHDDWDSGAKYKFEYGVKDPHTGDHKSQWEISDGHGLKGGYTLDEPDGTKRYVQYKADKWHGFQAIVKRIGHAVHPQSYGAPFVVRHQDHQKQNGGNGNGFELKQTQHQDIIGSSLNGNDLWLQSNQHQTNSQQNGWSDERGSTGSNYNQNNGWKNGGGELLATSYANQKTYHH
nr:pro-resilin-like [Aedes albopictus]XP_029725120.1 pro-resilin-like [Aedes albopictus]XP_029725123.1 pro-resilin-like [Aedes albopictus]